jgi:hypothetical protein
MPAGGGKHFFGTRFTTQPVAFQDCQFGGGILDGSLVAVALTNCLLERTVLNLYDAGTNNNVSLYNNLFYKGDISLAHSGSGAWVVKDNLFDQNGIDYTPGITHGYNGYVTNADRLWPNQSTDKILTNAPVYLTGPLGRFYYPTNDGMLSACAKINSELFSEEECSSTLAKWDA